MTPKDHQLAIRLTESDYEWLRSEAERLEDELGLSVSMADVIRRLLMEARRGGKAAKPSGRKR